jgi:serine/threonine protein kinase
LKGSRSWREILARFVDAGRGLAAVHEVGLVHRDFKPDNVLVGDDGIVRVADFGLVLEDRGRSSACLSYPGELVGTKQYMPLEQILGDHVDARADQFAFCMSLYEALWGEMPFCYIGLEARAQALLDAEPRAPRRLRGLYRVIRRGLARDPNDRWPSMDGLLDALERVPRRRRRLAWAGIGVAILSVGLALVSPVRHTEPASCAGDPSAQTR